MLQMKLITDLLALFAAPPQRAATEMSEHSEFLDYAERESARTLDDLRAAFNTHFERATKVLTLLVGGAGAVAAYAMNNWQQLGRAEQGPLLVLCVGWSVAAIILSIWGMRVRSMGSGPALTEMAKIYAEHAGDPAQPQHADIAESALLRLRRAELNRRHLQIECYAKAVSEQTEDLRVAVVIAAAMPGLALFWWAVPTYMA